MKNGNDYHVDDPLWPSLVKVPFVVAIVVLVAVVVFLVSLSFYTTSNHGDNLLEFIQTTRALEYEVHAVFNAKGDSLYEVTQYEPSKVDFSATASWMANILGLGKTISVHNHPFGAPFSNTDILNEAMFEPAALMVVSDDNIFTLSAKYGWPSVEELQDFITEESGYYSAKEIFHDEALTQRFVRRFNFTYTVTPTDDWRLWMLNDLMPDW